MKSKNKFGGNNKIIDVIKIRFFKLLLFYMKKELISNADSLFPRLIEEKMLI